MTTSQNPPKAPEPKRPNPSCEKCRHAMSFHGRQVGGQCRALGCDCDGYQGALDTPRVQGD